MSPRDVVPRPLTLAFVRHVTTPGLYYDQDGLILRVTAGGGKHWFQRLTVNGRRRDIGLGSTLTLTPAQARKEAAKNRVIARSGGNPLAPRPDKRRTVKAEPREVTFSRFTLTRHRRLMAAGVAEKQVRADRKKIVDLVIPALERRPMSQIVSADIQEVLKAIAKTNVNTADAVRRQLGAIFDEAVEDGIRPDNPARSSEILVPKRRKRVSGEGESRDRRILAQLPDLLTALETTRRRPSIVLQFRFSLLTLAHPKECRLAAWSQIDMDRRIWRFPSMQKEGAEAVEVALHDGIITVLRKASLLGKPDGWVFPSPTDVNAPYTENAGYKLIKELGFDIKQLDFRRVNEFWKGGRTDGVGLEDWYAMLVMPKRS
ncbi:MAG: tyrosine-type recombinase/integrase [Alkalilacustris sp.]